MRIAPFVALSLALPAAPLSAAWVWVEGEQAATTNIGAHPWYAGQVKKELLSGGAFLAHYDATRAGEADYVVHAPEAGDYTLWLRANPVLSSLKYSLNDAALAPVVFSQGQTENTNIAANGAPDLRFLSWSRVGVFPLKAGANTLRFVMDSAESNHGAIDCFVFTSEPFTPLGTLKPDKQAAHLSEVAAANPGWTAWDAATDDFRASVIDLRPLNEKFAGENGYIQAQGERFVHARTGKPVRFWAVNGPPRGMTAPDDFKACARMLAKRGVNLVRIHGGVFDRKTGALLPDSVRQKQEIVAAMRHEGVYSLLSIYFPLWLTPENGEGWREGYDGKMHPFALLYFEPEFQKLYRGWWRELLTRPGADGRRLLDDPAIMAVELVNEDSLFFWTFRTENVPAPQLVKLEKRFGDWAAKKHGSLERALRAWHDLRHVRDDPAAGRLGFRHLHDLVTQKTPRDQDTAAFLLDTQRSFYADTTRFLRELGYKGMITASNWITANDDILGPLEKYSYLPGDFIDHHGYFGCNHRGEHSGWSIREGHTYSDVSALRFDAEEPGKPRCFSHPAMDPMYNRRPSTISETTWNRPNRHRGEAPLFYAAYGSLQDTDAIMHFSLEGAGWKVKPTFFMQPWTLTTPAMMGQFPAAALIYRLNLVKTGELMADLPITLEDALALKGTRLVQRAHLDELRKSDVAKNAASSAAVSGEAGIDPLIHLVGRGNLRIGEAGSTPPVLKDLAPFIDRERQIVTSSTRELTLDYGQGVLRIDAPAAQGVSGNLKAAGPVALGDLEIRSDLETGHIVAVALDGRPLAESSRILVQAMTEEKGTGFATEPAGEGVKRIVNLGQDPWLIREIQGTVSFKRADAARLKARALDINGYPAEPAGNADALKLLPNRVYYLVTP